MPIDRDAFRQTVGCFPTGVTVVTFSLPGNAIHGITVSSFVSLSLTPPLVGVAIGTEKRAHTMLPGLMRYGVSVLAENQAAASDHFAARPERLIGELFEALDDHPVLLGAAAQLVCDVVDLLPVGDHTLVVGRIEHARVGDVRPLAYARGRYGRIELS